MLCAYFTLIMTTICRRYSFTEPWSDIAKIDLLDGKSFLLAPDVKGQVEKPPEPAPENVIQIDKHQQEKKNEKMNSGLCNALYPL